jgi:hypothetical protein
MTTLYLMFAPSVSPPDASADGMMRSGGHGTTNATGDLISYECEMDNWAGEAVVEVFGDYVLATPSFLDAVALGGLSGLRVGNVADARYSSQGRRLAALGELYAKELPVFRIARGRHPIDVRTFDERSDAIGADDDLRYTGWKGEDFSSSKWGLVLTQRARDVVEAQYPAVLPRRRLPSWTCSFYAVKPR